MLLVVGIVAEEEVETQGVVEVRRWWKGARTSDLWPCSRVADLFIDLAALRTEGSQPASLRWRSRSVWSWMPEALMKPAKSSGDSAGSALAKGDASSPHRE